MPKISEEKARIAAKWWRARLERPKFDALGKGPSSPKERESMGMASMMATLLADKKRATPEALDKFEAALVAALVAIPDRPGQEFLGVDYGPDPMLADAADAAGIDYSLFPWKTRFWIHADGTMSGAVGYGAQPQPVALKSEGAEPR